MKPNSIYVTRDQLQKLQRITFETSCFRAKHWDVLKRPRLSVSTFYPGEMINKKKTKIQFSASFPAHYGPVRALQRNPCYTKNFLTVGPLDPVEDITSSSFYIYFSKRKLFLQKEHCEYHLNEYSQTASSILCASIAPIGVTLLW